ncbi:MAG: aminodeoxychorismate/anthranilate synthase component II [Candidatus Ratteibacteria bacterium]
MNSQKNFLLKKSKEKGPVLILDNYDSFTYNLAQYVGELGFFPQVVRNNERSLEEIESLFPSHIIISPGPGRPQDAGISKDLIKYFSNKIPILGICLGHQCIGETYGGKIVRARILMHGKSSQIFHKESSLFHTIPTPFSAIRYHSLIIEKESFPDTLEITATSDDGEIMAIQHRTFPIYGLQFHPESILTPYGKEILHTFLGQI